MGRGDIVSGGNLLADVVRRLGGGGEDPRLCVCTIFFLPRRN